MKSNRFCAGVLVFASAWWALVASSKAPAEGAGPKPPAVGDKAKDFEATSVEGDDVKLSTLLKEGPVVLTVLRGNPGYQCPVCNIQVGDFLKNADKFAEAKATVVLVYPGPNKGLAEKAKEFIADRTIPGHFKVVVDSDMELVTSYGLRWDAPHETAYPSTFVIDKTGEIRYALVSKSHGGRAKSADVLKSLQSAR